MIIGLTGSIASGKSTVAKMLEQYEFPIVDADLVARVVVEPGKPALQQIKNKFGEDIVLEDGNLNRPKLGNIIFNDPKKRLDLNAIMHPAIRKEMLEQRDKCLRDGHPVVIMDIPLLFESKLQHFVEKILVVSVTEENQLRRLMERNELSEADARARISSQLPISVKEEGADAVIYNNESLEETQQQLEAILRNWKVLK
ncbi:MAG: dephospho-CoA kinase [Kurthia sp.]|nr:dephospho-CoA kinase [Candidatus Kurthia equi]